MITIVILTGLLRVKPAENGHLEAYGSIENCGAGLRLFLAYSILNGVREDAVFWFYQERTSAVFCMRKRASAGPGGSFQYMAERRE